MFNSPRKRPAPCRATTFRGSVRGGLADHFDFARFDQDEVIFDVAGGIQDIAGLDVDRLRQRQQPGQLRRVEGREPFIALRPGQSWRDVTAAAALPAPAQTGVGSVTLAVRSTTASMKPYSLASSAREPAVPVRVGLDPLDRLAGVEGDPLGHHPLQVDDLLGLDGDVGGLPLHLARGLVHQDPAVGQGEALARACPRTAGTGPSRRPGPRRWCARRSGTNCMVS